MLLALIAVMPAGAQEITLEEYLGRVRENHPFFTKEELKVAVEERDAESNLGGQEWILSLTPSYSHLGEVGAGALGAERVDRAAM